MLLERISHAMVFLGLFGLPCAGTLYPRASYLGAFLASAGRFPAYAGRGGGYHMVVQAVPGVVHSTPVIEVGWAFCTLNCVALTAGTFLLFSCISIPQPPRFIAEMSRLSYGMFLMHIFWLGLWVSVFKSTLGLPTVAAIPVIAVCTFISCFVATKLISLIPGSKWIIG